MARPGLVEAAGGLLWRPADTRLGLEVALIHRPGKSNWSLPKGKLNADEHPILGALREVLEETGHAASLGPTLGSVTYVKGGSPKRVRYWSMAALDGDFRATSEVDDLLWLPPDAAARLARGVDQPVIERFWREGLHTTRALALVRPAPGSVKKSRTQGDEHGFPGWAAELAGLIGAFGIRRALACEVGTWRESLAGIAPTAPVLWHPLPSAKGQGQARAVADDLRRGLLDGMPTAVFADRSLLGRLGRELVGHRHEVGREVLALPRGAMCVLHIQGQAPGRVLSMESVSSAA